MHTAAPPLPPGAAACRRSYVAVTHYLLHLPAPPARSYGVAFLHETQSESEQSVARLLFESGAVQVLVATAPMCWGLTAAAHLTVIMGTQVGAAVGWAGHAMGWLLVLFAGRTATPHIQRCFLTFHLLVEQ